MSMDIKAVKVIFTVSIILNVLLLGGAGGLAYKHWNDKPYHAMHEEMSPESRNIVARTMQNAFRDSRADMKEARAIKKDIRALMVAPEFDAEAFDAKAEKLHGIMSAMGHKRIDITKELAAQLSQDDRRVLAEKFSKGFRGHDKKGSKETPHAFLKDQEKPSERIKGVRPLRDPEMPVDMPPQPAVTP